MKKSKAKKEKFKEILKYQNFGCLMLFRLPKKMHVCNTYLVVRFTEISSFVTKLFLI